MKKIRIILADDHKIFLDGIVSLLNEYEYIQIVGFVTSGEDLLELLKKQETDIVITDITMKGISGIDAAKLISRDYPSIKIIILSMHTSDEFVLNAVKSGVVGYLPKDSSIEELIDAINVVFSGGQYFSKEISNHFFLNYVKKFRSEQNIIEKEELTLREIEILKLAATGLTNKEIAEKLFISIKTVDAHKNHIMHKLKLKNTSELIIYAIKNKLIEL